MTKDTIREFFKTHAGSFSNAEIWDHLAADYVNSLPSGLPAKSRDRSIYLIRVKISKWTMQMRMAGELEVTNKEKCFSKRTINGSWRQRATGIKLRRRRIRAYDPRTKPPIGSAVGLVPNLTYNGYNTAAR